jgi:hypothetical protein
MVSATNTYPVMSIEEQILQKLQQIETDIATLKNLIITGKDNSKTEQEAEEYAIVISKAPELLEMVKWLPPVLSDMFIEDDDDAQFRDELKTKAQDLLRSINPDYTK